MVNFHLLTLAIALTFSHSAISQETQKGNWRFEIWGYTSPTHSTGPAACSGLASYLNTANPALAPYSGTFSEPNACLINASVGFWGGFTLSYENLPVVASCPSAGSSYAPNISTPVQPGSAPQTVTLADKSGCQITVTCSTYVEYDGSAACVGNASFTGQKGEPGQLEGVAPPAEVQKAEQLAKGMCPGEVNGVAVQVPCDSVTQPQASTTTTTNPDGSTTQATTATTCRGDQCTTTTTTTTTTPGGGSSTSTSSTTSGLRSFCQRAPDHPSCTAAGEGGSSSFTGSCNEGFTCPSGDAIACATARVLHEQQCAMTPASTALEAYNNAMRNPDVPNPNSTTQAITTGMFNTTSLIGAGSCSLNQTVTIAGVSMTLPFDQVCSALRYMGLLLQAIGFLIAFRIVSRG